MKHSIKELYIVQSPERSILATSTFVEQYQIPTSRTEREEARIKGVPYAFKASHHQAHKGYAKVYTPNSIDLIWMYGEKTWFDTKEERDVYRAQCHEQRQLSVERNKAKARLMQYIETHMTTEQILDLLQQLEG